MPPDVVYATGPRSLPGYRRVVRISALVILLGLVLILLSSIEGGLVATFLSTLGSTLTIAGIVTVTFEALTHSFAISIIGSIRDEGDKAANEIEKASTEKYLRDLLPFSMFEAVSFSITQDPFFYKDHKWRIELSSERAPPGFLFVTHTSEYTAVNWTHMPQKFVLLHELEKVWDYEYPNTTRFTRLRVAYGGSTRIDEDEGQLLRSGRIDPGHGSSPIFVKYDTGTGEIPSNGEVQVVVERKRIVPVSHEYPFVTFRASTKIDITVIPPKDVQLAIWAVPLYSSRAHLIPSRKGPAWEADELNHHWVLGETLDNGKEVGVLPGNGISIMWHPVSAGQHR